MGIANKAVDLTFKALTAGLGATTLYLTGTFSLNVYKGITWHNAQSKVQEQSSSSSEQKNE